MAQTTLRDYLQEIEDAISSGRSGDALTRCQTVLAQFPESLEAQRLMGEVYLAQGHLEEAQQAFDWVLTNDPENVIVYCDRALISERTSDYDTALDCYQQAYELSRGNAHIRQQFNELSAKTGQQGFMLSRAGLARLYMRGDLLSQAVQEWETVLTANPERLDARTGLLETYWREGLSDRVEQLAKQILQDVPGCLKALLLLAHVTSTKNMPYAQELLQKADALDPDQAVAHELFTDVFVNQPNTPFLQLLNRSPAVVDSSSQPRRQDAYTSAAGMPDTATVAEAFSHWSSSDNLAKQEMSPFFQLPTDSIAASADPWSVWGTQQNVAPLQESAGQTIPSSNDITAHGVPWNTTRQGTQQYQEPQMDPWMSRLEAQSDAVQQHATFAQPSWDSQNILADPGIKGVDSWENLGHQSGPPSTWGLPVQDEKAPAPPVWLDMLSQGERRQLSGGMPSLSALEQVPTMQPASGLPIQPAKKEEPKVAPFVQRPDESQVRAQSVKKEEPKVTPEEEEDGFSFGPEWLKSLGAAAIEDSTPAESSPVIMPAATSTPKEQEEHSELPAWNVPLPEAPVSVPVQASPVVEPLWAASVKEPAWESQLTEPAWANPASHSAEKTEQSLLATLEELEHGLLSQGFVPLEPNSLATIAQVQEVPSASAEIVVPEPTQVVVPVQEPTLSSALAGLGDAAPSRAAQEEPHIVPVGAMSSAQSLSTPTLPPMQEPQRMASQSAFSGTPPEPQKLPVVPPVPPARVEMPPEAKRDSTVVPSLYSGTTSAQAARTPIISRETTSDDELEMTMKRPAIRVQPIQKRSLTERNQVQPTNKLGGYVAAERNGDGNLSHQERLIQGYQYQLTGNYDGAMQEYRMIIRSAPEMLGEVISNVRALLKLAPKYSAGYRVLGDAYMRQGEYLQAMESYNKALTMAKKAKN